MRPRPSACTASVTSIRAAPLTTRSSCADRRRDRVQTVDDLRALMNPKTSIESREVDIQIRIIDMQK